MTMHGNKRYLQILLDPNRAQFLDSIAAEHGIKTNALVREVLYEFLENNVEESDYERALLEDQALWARTVRNRVEGRKKKKAKPAPVQESKNFWLEMLKRFGSEHQS